MITKIYLNNSSDDAEINSINDIVPTIRGKQFVFLGKRNPACFKGNGSSRLVHNFQIFR